MSPLLRGSTSQRLRLATGLILFAFAGAHFINHAFGIWSVDAMEAAQAWRTAVTRSWPVSLLLAAALLAHAALGIARVVKRRSLRMPFWEAAQIALGLAIPFFLLPHIVYMRIAAEAFGFEASYRNALAIIWPGAALGQSLLLLIVWVHGCIGLHFWLRLWRGYRRLAPLLLCVAVLVPALGLAGTVAAGRQVEAGRVGEGGPAADGLPARGAPGPGGDGPTEEQIANLALLENLARGAQAASVGIGIALAGLFAVRAARRRFVRRVTIRYTGGPDVTAPVGPTLLEISRMAGVPHAAVCGGRARCSTCRVRIEEAAGDLDPPGPAESATLKRVGAAPNVRLACQFRPKGDMRVTRLIRPPERGAIERSDAQGAEHVLAVLFLDIRQFTAISEPRLPYDTVFLLNRFFADVGEAITASGGWIDKYMGDGLMALFGRDQPVGEACRRALLAARRIDAALERFNADLKGELDGPLRIGMGLHVGPLVMGRIGHPASAAMTVIGRTVNVASRLEQLTKAYRVQIVASASLLNAAGLDRTALRTQRVRVRGVAEPILVALIAHGADLPELDPEQPPRIPKREPAGSGAGAA